MDSVPVCLECCIGKIKMGLEYLGRIGNDSGTFGPIYRAKGGNSGGTFVVKITTEAFHDKGEDACLQKGKEKFRMGQLDGDGNIIVGVSDFR